MKLTANELLKLSHGALSVGEDNEGYISLYRFSEMQRAYYKATNAHFLENQLMSSVSVAK